MKTSDNGINLIKKYEGCKLTAYKDSVGTLTIGIGHTKGVKEGQTITEAQAIEYLKNDLKNAETQVNKRQDIYNFNQNEFDALVSFTFNLGGGNLTKLTAKDTRSKKEIANKIPAYNKAGGKVLNGLTKRREAERELFLTSVSDLTDSVEYYPAYTGTLQNIDSILKAVGLPSKYYGSLAKRKALVIALGGDKNYSGTYAQNLILIQLAKDGKIKKVN